MMWGAARTTIVLSVALFCLGMVNGTNEIHDYTFDQFRVDYEKDYDTEELNLRQTIFEENLQLILDHNTKQRGGYVLGINPWMDLRPSELPTGYNKLLHPSYHAGTNLASMSAKKHTIDTIPQDLKNTLGDSLVGLPETVDWRTAGVATPVKNQAFCGSCWAFASTAVLESHLAIETGHLMTLSTQEMVSCAENPLHCGGAGGCTGATAEVAYELIAEHGVVTEDFFPYESGHGGTFACSLETMNSPHVELELQRRQLRGSNGVEDSYEPSYYQGTVASIDSYLVLPSNDYGYLMNAVAKLGPVVVSVAASGWGLYKEGVYSPPEGSSTDINHAVVLMGYGTDPETEEDYWLVRNSWGTRWGEEGYIRLKRDMSSHCAMDDTPADGDGCTVDGNGNTIVPPPVEICGTCGILFDSVIPLGGDLLTLEGTYVSTMLEKHERNKKEMNEKMNINNNDNNEIA